MKSIISLMAAAAFSVATLVAPAFAANKGTVGIAMPTKASSSLDRRRQQHRQAASRPPATAPTCNMATTTFRTSSRRSRTWSRWRHQFILLALTEVMIANSVTCMTGNAILHQIRESTKWSPGRWADAIP